MSKAVTYSLNQREYLCAFLDHGEIEISNNQVENAIRPIVALSQGILRHTGNHPAEAPAADVDRVIVRYDRTATSGVAIKNSADKFPQTIRLILKVLIVDPCDASQLRAAYIDIPSFQPSPEVSITFSSDGTIDFSGDLQVNYCSSDQELYSVYVLEDDTEDED